MSTDQIYELLQVNGCRQIIRKPAGRKSPKGGKGNDRLIYRVYRMILYVSIIPESWIIHYSYELYNYILSGNIFHRWFFRWI